jgi:hypothetical protein
MLATLVSAVGETSTINEIKLTQYKTEDWLLVGTLI